MLTRLQEFHDYVFGNRADVEASLKQVPDQHKATQRTRKIEKIRAIFFGKINPIIAERYRETFRKALRRLEANTLEAVLYGNATDSVEPSTHFLVPDELEIQKQFKKFEKEHQFFEAKECKAAPEKFSRFFKITKLIRYFSEQSEYDPDNITAYQQAYKLLVIFGNQDDPKKYFQALGDYVKNHNFQQVRNPFHDILVWNLPKNRPPKRVIQIDVWRKIIFISGPKALRLFHLATDIEKHLKKPPENFQEALAIARSLTYKKAKLDPELADVCMQYGVKESVFNQCLVVKAKRKKFDNLPNVVVDGNEVEVPGYFLTKLPINDPRAFILGYITHCCQSIGSHAQICVIDGVTKANNGFYVLLKRKQTAKATGGEAKKSVAEVKTESDIYKRGENGLLQIDYAKYDIVGQGYAWLSVCGNLTFDSWENLHQTDNPIVAAMLKLFSRLVMEKDNSSILRITIGTGGKTPDEFLLDAPYPEKPLEGSEYGDSRTQKLIAENTRKQQELLSELSQEMQNFERILEKNECKNSSELVRQIFGFTKIYSCQTADFLKALLRSQLLLPYFVEPGKRAILLRILKYEKIHQRFGYNYIGLANQLTALCDSKGKFPDIDKAMEKVLSAYASRTVYFLCLAIQDDNVEVLKLLMEEKPNFNKIVIRGKYGTPLACAVLTNNIVLIKSLLDTKANVNFADDRGVTPLSRVKSFEAAKLLLEARADVNVRDEEKYTPLLRVENNFEYLRLLLEMKANPNVSIDSFAYKDSVTPLQQSRPIEEIELLLSYGAKVNFATWGKSPLSCAIVDKRIAEARLLLKAKANVKEKGLLNLAVLYCKSDTGIIKELLARKADAHERNYYKGNLLHLAIESKEIELVKIFLEAKVNPDLGNHNSDTSLHLAMKAKNSCEVVKLLLAAKANVNAKNSGGETPVVLASSYGLFAEREILLAAGAKPPVEEKSLTAVPGKNAY